VDASPWRCCLIFVIVVFSIAKLWEPAKTFLLGTEQKIEWPGLHGNVLSAAGRPISSTIYNLQWLSSPGTLLLLCGILVAAVYRISPAVAAREYGPTAYKLRFAFLTVASVLALAYVMNQSGQTLTIGTWIAATGAFFASSRPSSAGSVRRSPGRTRRLTRCSPPCSRRPPVARGSIRRCSSPPIPPVGWSAR
jgi:L-lactate permease